MFHERLQGQPHLGVKSPQGGVGFGGGVRLGRSQYDRHVVFESRRVAKRAFAIHCGRRMEGAAWDVAHATWWPFDIQMAQQPLMRGGDFEASIGIESRNISAKPRDPLR